MERAVERRHTATCIRQNPDPGVTKLRGRLNIQAGKKGNQFGMGYIDLFNSQEGPLNTSKALQSTTP